MTVTESASRAKPTLSICHGYGQPPKDGPADPPGISPWRSRSMYDTQGQACLQVRSEVFIARECAWNRRIPLLVDRSGPLSMACPKLSDRSLFGWYALHKGVRHTPQTLPPVRKALGVEYVPILLDVGRTAQSSGTYAEQAAVWQFSGHTYQGACPSDTPSSPREPSPVFPRSKLQACIHVSTPRESLDVRTPASTRRQRTVRHQVTPVRFTEFPYGHIGQ